MIVFVQTFGGLVNVNPHLHVLDLPLTYHPVPDIA